MLAKTMQMLGHTVSVVVTGDPEQTDFDGIETHRLPCSSYGLNLRWRRIAELGKDADLIQTFTYHGQYPSMRAARYLDIPVVCMVLALFGPGWQSIRGNVMAHLFRQLERRLLDLPFDARVFLSDFSLSLAGKIGLRPGNDHVIEPGISLELYRPSGHKEGVLFSGKLEGRKGIQQVLDTARDLPDIPFTIMGWGDVSVMQDRPASVSRFVNGTNLTLADLMSRASIFVFPTKVETFGLAVAEAMASGCAIVSSSQLPFSGVRLADTSVRSITKGIQELVQDPVRCMRCGTENIEKAKRYNWQRHGQAMDHLYQSLTEGK